MILANLFRWTGPSTWPWFVFVWLAFMLAGFLKPLWRWFQKHRAGGWPTAIGQIWSTEVDEFKGSFFSPRGKYPAYVAELRYSYSADGQEERGSYKREFATEAEAQEFVRELKGKPVAVQYDPNKASRSALSEASVETLLKSRPPNPEGEPSATVGSVPDWLKPFLWVFVALSAVGLVLSLWVHFGAVMGRRVAPAPYFWILHMGIFVVWFPAVFVAKQRVGNTRRKDFWKAVLQGSPDWMRFMVYGFLAYAVVNFALFMLKAPNGSTGANPPAEVWRGFSGHWMAFYSAALAILYAAGTAKQNSPRCLNGHRVPPNATFCPRCGQPAIHS